MRRQKPELRREEILATTVALMDSMGIGAVRIQDVAKTLGVSSALVHYHFDTRGALFAGAFEYFVAKDMEKLEKLPTRGNSAERLRRILRQYGPTGGATSWRLWMDAWSLAIHDKEVRKWLAKLDLLWREKLETAIKDGVQLGEFTCADPAATVMRISAITDGLSIAYLIYRSITRAQLCEWMMKAAADELGIDVNLLLGEST